VGTGMFLLGRQTVVNAHDGQLPQGPLPAYRRPSAFRFCKTVGVLGFVGSVFCSGFPPTRE